MKTLFKHIATPTNYGRIFIQTYQCDGVTKTLAFTPIEPVQMDSAMSCTCGCNYWNASNLVNNVHFCPDREIDVEKTDKKAMAFRTLPVTFYLLAETDGARGKVFAMRGGAKHYLRAFDTYQLAVAWADETAQFLGCNWYEA